VLCNVPDFVLVLVVYGGEWFTKEDDRDLAHFFRLMPARKEQENRLYQVHGGW